MTRKEIAATASVVAVAEIVLMFGIPAFWQARVAMKSVVVATILTSSWVAGIVS